MKLLKNQYQDILNALVDQNIGQEKLTLVKKKGRIQVRIEGLNSLFEFFSRKSVSLSETDHQWQKSEHYLLNIHGTSTTAGDWEEVVTQLKKWLQAHPVKP